MVKLLNHLHRNGFLQTKQIDGENLFIIATPCIFRIESEIVRSLIENYKSTEEIGGVLSAKPTLINNKLIFVITNVNYIRNAIEDNARQDGRNRTNAYLPDLKQLYQEISMTLENECLPIRFHTHPTKSNKQFETLLNENILTETSNQDRIASEYPNNIDGQKLLMPRCLIVGNAILSSNIFIGVYGGFVALNEFNTSKRKVMEENIKKTADFFSAIKLTTGQKIGLGIGAALLLFATIKYPKYSLPVIAALALTAPVLLTSTQNIEKPEYFNRLSIGKADIYIP